MTQPPDDISEAARHFAVEYLLDFDLHRAAARANVYVKDAQAYLQDHRVQSIIRDGKRRASDRVNISVDWALEKLRRIGESSPVDYFDDDGRLKKPSELTPEQRDAIKSIKHTRNGPQVETHDKVAAVTKVGQFLGIFADKVEHSGTIETKRLALSKDDIKAELEAQGLPTSMFDE